MLKRINFRFVRFCALSVFLLGVQVFAQFEVSPDHFDSPATKQAHRRTTAKSQAKAARAASAVVAQKQKKTTARKNKPATHQPQTSAALRNR